jgi:hypothetical protein
LAFLASSSLAFLASSSSDFFCSGSSDFFCSGSSDFLASSIIVFLSSILSSKIEGSTFHSAGVSISSLSSISKLEDSISSHLYSINIVSLSPNKSNLASIHHDFTVIP